MKQHIQRHANCRTAFLSDSTNVAKLGEHFEIFDAQYFENDFDPLTSKYK